jgi:hypothetical protein
MDKKSAGVFTKDVVVDSVGLLEIGVDIIVLGQTKTYTGVALIMVKE